MYNKTTEDQGYYYIRPKALNNDSNNLGLSFYKELMFNTCLSFNSYKVYIYIYIYFRFFITVRSEDMVLQKKKKKKKKNLNYTLYEFKK